MYAANPTSFFLMYKNLGGFVAFEGATIWLRHRLMVESDGESSTRVPYLDTCQQNVSHLIMVMSF